MNEQMNIPLSLVYVFFHNSYREGCLIHSICHLGKAGAVFTKGLSQVLRLSCLYFYTKVKPKIWLKPFVNTAPGL